MIALYRHLAAELLVSQRYLTPLLICAGLMAVGTTGDDGPLTSAYAYGTAAVLVATVWATRTIADAEEPSQRAVTVVAVGGPDRHLAATVALAVSGGVTLMLVGLGYPLLAGRHSLSWASVGVGAAAQFCAVLVAVTIGLLTSRRTIAGRGAGAVLALAAVVAVIAVDHLSPIRPAILLLSGTRTAAQDAGPLTLLTGISLVTLAVAVLLTRAVGRRRD